MQYASILRQTFRLIVLLLALCWSRVSVHGEEPLHAIRILPGDIVQGSIQRFQTGTNQFAVTWTYTEQGARKWLIFRRMYAGREVIKQVGTFEFRSVISDPTPSGYIQESWLTWRTDAFFRVSAAEANKLIAGLTGW